jgi:hypothetical protein
MRRAYELAFAAAFTLAGARPTFLMCDEITFARPVDVGDLLRFRAGVVHTALLRHGPRTPRADRPLHGYVWQEGGDRDVQHSMAAQYGTGRHGDHMTARVWLQLWHRHAFD